MAIVWALAVLLVALFGIRLYIKKQRVRIMIDQIPGPPSVLGNFLDFPKSASEMWNRMRRYSRDYYPIYRLWGNIGLTINLVCPEDIELILSNSKHIQKGDVYRYLRNWLGNGLLTSSGDKWRGRRKILTAGFHFTILHQFVNIIQEQADMLVGRLKSECDKPYTLIGPFITQYTLNTICETAMGIRLNSLEDNSAYEKAFYEIGNAILYRACRPWLSYDAIYKLTAAYRKELQIINILKAFSMSVIKQRKDYVRSIKSVPGDSSPQKRLAMLDLLISAQDNGAGIDDEGIREEVDTFLLGGYDTSAAILSFTLMLLACHKDVQDRIVKEFNDVTGDTGLHLTFQDLQNLRYLERVLKEAMRMYPSIPFIARIAGEDVKTYTGYSIPAGCCINIQIYDLHHNPNIYSNPYKFDPDRFLPEHTQKRHPYAYLPFSAGPRNCIGQKYAMLNLKLTISEILKNYILEPVDTPSTINLHALLVLRTADPIKIKIRPRYISMDRPSVQQSGSTSKEA